MKLPCKLTLDNVTVLAALKEAVMDDAEPEAEPEAERHVEFTMCVHNPHNPPQPCYVPPVSSNRRRCIHKHTVPCTRSCSVVVIWFLHIVPSSADRFYRS